MNSTSTKQKLVIVLKGVPNSGKTTTLNYLIQFLQGVEDPLTMEEDQRVLISYQRKRVYVATLGDDDDETKESVRLFQENDYDILVTAAWSWGKTHAPIDEYAEALHVAPVRVKKIQVKEGRDEATRAQAQDIEDIIDGVNRAQAHELKDRIDAFIKAHP